MKRFVIMLIALTTVTNTFSQTTTNEKYELADKYHQAKEI